MAAPMESSNFDIIYAPNPFNPQESRLSVFLSGSIDMGKAVEWQQAVASHLADLPITVLNPRRLDWDDTWVEDMSFAPFREQVEWEVEMLDKADVIAMYFAPDTKAPITLLEFGLHARQPGKLLVACPKGYWKRGNVQIVCARFGITLFETQEQLVAGLQERLREMASSRGLASDG